MNILETQTTRNDQLTRCAVCKIDLKGRFVYVDEEIENLLGFTKEELFGKSISEFTTLESQDLIEAVLTHRNHYESFYDATEITLVNRQKQRIRTSAVISLNFIAGNPVNYQLIINALECIVSAPRPEAAVSATEEFLNSVISMDDPLNMKSLVRYLRKWLGAESMFIYLVSEGEISPRAGDSGAGLDSSFDEIPLPTELHKVVTETAKPYSFLDDSAVQQAIELFGEAPMQVILQKDMGVGTTYIFSAQFGPAGSDLHGIDPVERLESGLALINRLASACENTAVNDQNVDVKFTVGFLDSIGIGAALISYEGQVIGYNPAFADLMAIDSFTGDVNHLLDCLVPDNSRDMLSHVVDYLKSDLEADADSDLELEIIAPNDAWCRFIIVRFSTDADDMSSCLVMIPSQTEERAGRSIAPIDKSLMTIILESVGSMIDGIHEVSQRLTHQHYEKLTKSGKGLMRRLDSLSGCAKAALADITTSEHLARSNENQQDVDLNLTLDCTVERVQRRHPESTFTCKYENIPILRGNPDFIGHIFETMFENMLRLTTEPELVVEVCGRTTNGRLVVSLTHTVPPLQSILVAPDKLERKALTSFSSKYGWETLSAILAVRYLLQCVGGAIEVLESEGSSNFIEISMPVGEMDNREE